MTQETTAQGPYENLQPGDCVRHAKFGEGQIMQRSGTGKATKFIVAFTEEGEKRLMARLAKLKKIRPIEVESKEPAAANGA